MKRNKLFLATTLAIALAVAANEGQSTPVIVDHFDDGVLGEWNTSFLDNGSGANGWDYDESETQQSWLTVQDVLSPSVNTNRWLTVDLSRSLSPLNDFQLEAAIAWDSEKPPNYPGGQLEASQGLYVEVLDDAGNTVAMAAYFDNWGLNTGDRGFWTSSEFDGASAGALPLSGSATIEIIRTGDVFEFLWDGVTWFSATGTTSSIVEIRLRFQSFDPDLTRVTPRSYMGNLAIDYLMVGGDLATPECGDLPATIVGTSDSEVLLGTPGNDVIWGGGGRDLIRGRGGDDIICGGSDVDVIFGNAGDDRVHGGAGDDFVYGGPGMDFLSGGLGADVLVGGAGADILEGNEGDDRVMGGGGNDVVEGHAGNDILVGNGGSDLIVGDTGVDVCDGGPADSIATCEITRD